MYILSANLNGNHSFGALQRGGHPLDDLVARQIDRCVVDEASLVEALGDGGVDVVPGHGARGREVVPPPPVAEGGGGGEDAAEDGEVEGRGVGDVAHGPFLNFLVRDSAVFGGKGGGGSGQTYGATLLDLVDAAQGLGRLDDGHGLDGYLVSEAAAFAVCTSFI